MLLILYNIPWETVFSYFIYYINLIEPLTLLILVSILMVVAASYYTIRFLNFTLKLLNICFVIIIITLCYSLHSQNFWAYIFLLTETFIFTIIIIFFLINNTLSSEKPSTFLISTFVLSLMIFLILIDLNETLYQNNKAFSNSTLNFVYVNLTENNYILFLIILLIVFFNIAILIMPWSGNKKLEFFNKKKNKNFKLYKWN